MEAMKASDVLVIGGGPAGSTMAAMLGMRGHDVTVLEKEHFPRDHVGESLLPYCYGLFEELGVLDRMQGSFVRKPGVRFLDSDGTTSTTWCFGHVIKDPSYLSFHVLRDQFDLMLLENAARHGASVEQGTRVTDVDLDDPDGEVRVHAVGPDGSRRIHRARFLVDASGRDTFLANRMKSKRAHPGLDRAALSTHWVGADYIGGIEEGLLQIIYLGGDKQGWIWAIPVGTDRVSVGVVVNHSYLRARKRELLDQGITDWRQELYVQEIMQSPYIAALLANARTGVIPLMLNGDYSYSIERKHGANFAIVGDASAFIDPIFASGVYLSMNSSRLVADAVDAKLARNADADAAMRATYEKIEGAYRLVDELIQLFYDPVAINFAQAGSIENVMHEQHANAMAIGHYLLAGDFFDNYKRYHRFAKTLRDPTVVKRYRSFVIERPELQTTDASCGSSWADVFAGVAHN